MLSKKIKELKATGSALGSNLKGIYAQISDPKKRIALARKKAELAKKKKEATKKKPTVKKATIAKKKTSPMAKPAYSPSGKAYKGKENAAKLQKSVQKKNIQKAKPSSASMKTPKYVPGKPATTRAGKAQQATVKKNIDGAKKQRKAQLKKKGLVPMYRPGQVWIESDEALNQQRKHYDNIKKIKKMKK